MKKSKKDQIFEERRLNSLIARIDKEVSIHEELTLKRYKPEDQNYKNFFEYKRQRDNGEILKTVRYGEWYRSVTPSNVQLTPEVIELIKNAKA